MRQGGKYRVEKPGQKPKLVHRTENPAGGLRARDAQGRELDDLGHPVNAKAPGNKPSAGSSTPAAGDSSVNKEE